MGGTSRTHGRIEKCMPVSYNTSAWKPEVKRSLERLRKHNIKWNLREMGCEGVNWIQVHSRIGPIVGLCVINLPVPHKH
jgi:hypothetical protein